MPEENSTETASRKLRFESREQLPDLFELKATEIEPKQGRETKGYWVANTTHDFKRTDVPFIPPVQPGSWITKHPRSVMLRKDAGGYIQIKGTGNPDKPNFPPLLSPKSKDYGHTAIWSVSKDEVEGVMARAVALDKVDVEYSPLIKLVKLEEVPVPINDKGGAEIRSIKDAYTKPWEYADHVRRQQLDLMKRVLREKHDLEADRDDDIITLYQENEGFYQIQTEKTIPFKNEITHLTATPLVLDYLSGNTVMSLKSQAENVHWVMKEFGKAFGIDALANSELPDYEDLLTEMEVVDDSVLSDKERFDDWRLFTNTFGDKTTASSAKKLRQHFDLSDTDPLLQLDGVKYVNRILESLDKDSKQALLQEITNAQDQLAKSLVNATLSGISLNQTIGSKDSVLGKVSDIGALGIISHSTKRIFEDEVIASLKYSEIAYQGSCVALAAVAGVDIKDPLTTGLLKIAYARTISLYTISEAVNAKDYGIEGYGQRYQEAATNICNQIRDEYSLVNEKKKSGSSDYYSSMVNIFNKYPIVLVKLALPNIEKDL